MNKYLDKKNNVVEAIQFIEGGIGTSHNDIVYLFGLGVSEYHITLDEYAQWRFHFTGLAKTMFRTDWAVKVDGNILLYWDKDFKDIFKSIGEQHG